MPVRPLIDQFNSGITSFAPKQWRGMLNRCYPCSIERQRTHRRETNKKTSTYSVLDLIGGWRALVHWFDRFFCILPCTQFVYFRVSKSSRTCSGHQSAASHGSVQLVVGGVVPNGRRIHCRLSISCDQCRARAFGIASSITSSVDDRSNESPGFQNIILPFAGQSE